MVLLRDQEARQFFIDRLHPRFFEERENISEEFQTLGYLFFISSPRFDVDSLLNVPGGYRVMASLLYNEVIPVNLRLDCRELLYGPNAPLSSYPELENPIIPLPKHDVFSYEKFKYGLVNQEMAEKYSRYIMTHLQELGAHDLDIHIFLHANIGWSMSNEEFDRLSARLQQLKPERTQIISTIQRFRNKLNTHCAGLPDKKLVLKNSFSTDTFTQELFLRKVFNLCGATYEERSEAAMRFDFRVTSYDMYKASLYDTKRLAKKKITKVNAQGKSETVEVVDDNIKSNGREVISNTILYMQFLGDTMVLPYNLNKPITEDAHDYEVRFFDDECWLMGVSHRMFDYWIDESRKEYNE